MRDDKGLCKNSCYAVWSRHPKREEFNGWCEKDVGRAKHTGNTVVGNKAVEIFNIYLSIYYIMYRAAIPRCG